MKFKFVHPISMNTPNVGVCSPGEVKEYKDDDPRCQQLKRSSFFKEVQEHKIKKVKKVKDNEEDKV
jgi:hypothetical protein